MPLTLLLALPFIKKINYGIWNTVSRFFSTTELRLFTVLRESLAIIYALSEYESLIQGSQNPIILYTDLKPVLSLCTQQNKPSHKVYKFQLTLMKFPNLHIVWTEKKNLSQPDLLSRSLTTTTQGDIVCEQWKSLIQ